MREEAHFFGHGAKMTKLSEIMPPLTVVSKLFSPFSLKDVMYMFAKQCGIFFSYQHDLGLVLKYLGLLEGLYLPTYCISCALCISLYSELV